MKITKRDIEILNFLKEVCVADTSTLSILFFNGSIRRCNQRLKILKDNKKVKCFRESVLSKNIYYIGRKPANWKHKIIFSQLLAELKLKEIEVLKYRSSFKIGSLIADGLIVINDSGEVKIYFVEGERTKKLDINKYELLYYSREWENILPVMPGILCITDKNINTDHKVLNIKSCKWDLSNLKI